MGLAELQKRYEEAESMAYKAPTSEERRRWGRIADSRHGDLVASPDFQQWRKEQEENERWRQHVEDCKREYEE